MLDFSLLTEFNHALVYGFEPESTPERLAGDNSFVASIIPDSGQYQDMFDAYLYAQNTILPKLKANQGKLAKEELIGIIKDLHKLIGKHVMKLDNPPIASGNYTELIIMRWHKGASIKDHFVYYLSNQHDCKNDTAFIRFISKKFDLKVAELKAFLAILKIVKNSKQLQPDPSQLDYLNSGIEEFKPGSFTLAKLHTAYFNDFLTSEQKLAVDKIVKLCMPPSKISTAMDVFADRTLTKFAQVDRLNNNQIAGFVSQLFYELTDIHPFGNGNGRVATCLVNIFLRYFDLPSILFKHPGDNENPNSHYSIAIKQIDISRDPLKRLILDRIAAAQQQPFTDDVQKETIKLRVEMRDIALRILQKVPGFDLEIIISRISPKSYELASFMDLKNASLMFAREMHQIATAQEALIDSQRQPAIATSKVGLPGFGLSVLTPEKRQEFIKNLEALTKFTGWKIGNREGLITPWIECANEGQARELFARMESAQLSVNTVAQRADAKAWVVKCEKMDFQLLAKKAAHIDQIKLDPYVGQSLDHGFFL